MKAYIDTQENKLLLTNDLEFTPWHLPEEVRARSQWVDFDEADRDFLKVESGALVVDTAEKAAVATKAQARAARRARLLTHDVATANSIAALRPIVADLLAELRGD